MPDLTPIKRMEIFKTGRHVDSKGNPFEATTDVLDSIAANFNADSYKPPAVVGHPKLDDPRYGDMLSVYREGNKLYADVGLIPEFHELVKKGMYPDRSVRLGKTADGGWTVKHIGFLGATPPAVKGLAPIQFSGEGAEVDFCDYQMSSIGSIFQRLRDYFIETLGLDKADNLIRQYEIDDLKQQPMDDAQPMPAFSNQNTTGGVTVGKTVEELERELETVKKQNADFATKEAQRDKEFAATQAENKRLKAEGMKADFSAFCDSMPEQITPAMKPAIMDFMEILSGAEEFEFAEGAEGEGKRVKAQPVERFKALLKGLPKQVDFSETATKGKATDKTGKDREALISDFMEANKDADYKSAVLAVSKEHPDLFKEE